MSATSSISSTSAPSSKNNNNSNNVGTAASSSSSNIVILENQLLDSNDVVAAASLQQLSNAGGTIKLTRDCALQYSNLINSYASNNSSSSSGNSSNNNGSSQMNTVNIIPGDASQTSSRVQVLSNVQLVSKGGSQPSSTFSYVDASGKNFNVLTSSGKISTNKLISVPITKVKSFNHIGQQQPQQQQSTAPQILSSQLQQQQKVTVPRSIQLVTRIPNSTISVSNGRVQQITPTISSSTQPQFSIQQYADSGTSISASALDVKAASTPVPIVSSTNSTKTTGKGKAASMSLKMMQNPPINPGPKSSVAKGMSVSLKSVRNNSKNTVAGINPQYYVKSSTNGTLQQPQPGTTTSIYTTSPAQAVYHNPTPHPPQQQQQQPMQFPISTVPSTGKGKGVYKTSKNQLIQLQQQQQPQQSPQRSVTPQSPSPSSYSVPLSTTTSRYQNYNSYSIPSSQSTQPTTTTATSSYKTTYNQLYPAANSYDSSSVPLSNAAEHQPTPPPPSHQVQPSMTVTGYTSTTGKASKKYGASTLNNNSEANFTAVTPIKVKGGRGRNNSMSNYQPIGASDPATPYQQRYSASPSRPQQQFQQQQNQQITTTSSRGGDEHYFINGQQMTDETSARILQSLSQKSASAEPVKYKPQQQFTFYGSDSVPQSPSSVPATFIPGSVAPTSSSTSSSSSASNTNIPGIVYDPSDSRFYEDKPDGRRRTTSTSEIITYADNIPLREGYPPDYKNYPRVDDDHIGEEVRPAPVDTSNGRYFLLQAVMQDHTYFAPPPEIKPPEPPPTPTAAPVAAPAPAPAPTPPVITPASLHQHPKQKSCTPAPIPTANAPTQPSAAALPTATVPAPLTQMSLSSLAAYTSSVAAAAASVSPAPGQPNLDYIYQRAAVGPQDDDANSVISTGSRSNFNALDNDLGEETETAPEGEGEDDSVTRCICDLTHDDGYMICCDKCSAWQHVDCMGIDRMNIPDEYNCEMCQPRAVDRNRARMLQLEKRKEQSLFLANNNLQQIGQQSHQQQQQQQQHQQQQQQQQQQVADPAVTSTNLISVPGGLGGTGGVGSGGKGANQYTTGKVLAGAKKTKTTGASSKKKAAAEGGVVAVPKKASKKTAENALNRLNGKRKELKKPSKKKAKTTEQNAEKMSNMIRTWIDNYERAITNHYSPELRARLQAFGKMQSQNPLLNSDRLIPAASVTNLMQKCTTVPHAGGKILISTGDIEPKTPIIEIRGKYMISSQHKQLQSLFNMAANGKLSNNKNAGPFLFLYQLTNGGMELCVDTRTYGNDARFVRRSCRPNAEILHNVDKGVVHLYIVSTSNIKANTEITIKHDEQLIQRVGGVVILTHTTVTNLCACGLIKECQYSAQLSEGLVPTPTSVTPTPPAIAPAGALANIGNTQSIPGMVQQTPGVLNCVGLPTVTPSGKPSKSKKNNGALADGEKKPAKKRNSRSTSSNPDTTRMRSISSSGDSTNEMLMYVQQQQQQQQQPPLSPMHQHQQQQPFQQIPSQLISQQMHFMHQQSPTQQQQQPQMLPLQLSQAAQVPPMVQQQPQQPPVYMYSPTPPQIMVPRTPPPPVSPSFNNRPGFYTEIKSPLNSPPLNLSAGPPPLAIPSVKTLPAHPPSPQPTQLMPVIPQQQQQQQPAANLEAIHQQQQLHQQHIIEDVLKIKIKSPTASPVKRESAPSPIASSMLSPPPPPPIPIAQRPLCAETLKNELFHSHYSSPASPSSHPPPQQQHHQPLPLKSSPVKVDYSLMPSEFKLEPTVRAPTPPPPASPVAVKIEQEIKLEAAIPPVPEDVKPIHMDPLPLVKKEEEQSIPESPIKEQPVRAATPDYPMDEIKEEPGLCDSLPGSPVKSCTSLVGGHVSSSNSTNSSPIASHHHAGSGSSSKKKSVVSKDGATTPTTAKEEKKPSRKLTREERKMEAIVKAFEKMEQSQQRKQELKVQRKEGKRRSVSSSTPDEGTPCSSAKKRSLNSSSSSSQQKRKKKKSKSLSQHFGSPNQSRKKKVSKSSSKKAARSLCDRPYESKAAELLLTFSQSQSAEQSQSSYFGDDVKPIGGEDNNNAASNMSNLPLLSSACMLVEAAVGPLEQVTGTATTPSEQDFKFPQKAKTKKSMSREWLSGQVDGSSTIPFRRITPDQDSGYMSEDKSHDYRPSVTAPLGVDVTADPNICIAAKKVEEFIAQNSPQPDEVATVAPAPAPVEPCQTQQTSNVSESAAVKKRWLRQAISEETDELTQASSSPPPPNGFTTPLKKRRVIRQSEETTPQPQPILSAQKIDFASQPPQPMPTVVQTVPNFSDRSMYWSNAVPTYNPADEKHAIDLSRTAPPPPQPVVTPLVVQQQQPLIAPYKIVPIAQALTPLHFTDPDPLPLPPVLPPPQPVVEYVQPSYEPLPPPSAVAAMVPASLLPPEQPQQQQVRIDVSYPATTGAPRSKGSQKYIGSPAKFEQQPPSSSADSSVAETPEKPAQVSGGSSGSSVANSDVDEEPEQRLRLEQVEQDVVVPESVTKVEEMVTEEPTIAPEPEVVKETSSEVVHEEEEVVVGEVVVDQMEVSSTEIEETVVVAVEEPVVVEPTPPKPAEVMNGRDKVNHKAAPEEERENNELEDLQKVIASFHSENIMTLISRNKKAKKGSREGSGTKRQSKSKQSSLAKEEICTTTPVVASPVQPEHVEPVVLPEEPSVHAPVEIAAPEPEPEPVEPAPAPQPVPPPEETPVTILGRSYSHPSWVTTTDSYRDPPTEVRTSLSTLRPDIPQINYNSPSTYQSNAARNLLSSLSVGSEPLSSLTSFRSSSTFLDYPKPSASADATGSSSSIYQYRPSTEISTLLEKGFSSTRPTSFSTLGTAERVVPSGTPTTTSALSAERTVTSSFLSLSSPKVTENLSTLGGSTAAAAAANSYPKVLTKTARSDPRLNPALTTPEPVAPITPKRKLSINEYRKRKMQSCSTTTTSAATATPGSETVTSAGSSPGSTTTTSSVVVSSSLGSNDVSSSISKELSLELELELGGGGGGKGDDAGDVGVGTTTEPTSSTEEAV